MSSKTLEFTIYNEFKKRYKNFMDFKRFTYLIILIFDRKKNVLTPCKLINYPS